MVHEWIDQGFRYRATEDQVVTQNLAGGPWAVVVTGSVARRLTRLAEEKEGLLQGVGKAPEPEQAILARIREGLLRAIDLADTISEDNADYVRLRDLIAALDRICPAQETTSPSTTSSK